MAPFRAARSTRSGRPAGQNDQDVFDGLPVRQWRLNESMVDTTEDLNALNPPSKQEQTIWKELPMPKGSDHYAPWCQQLLKMARAGRIGYGQNGISTDLGQRGDNNAEGVASNGDANAANAARKDPKTGIKRGFMATRWTQLSKSGEEAEPEYLAKRRKGLQSAYTGQAGATDLQGSNARMRKTKVKRVDRDGHTYVWEVLVPEGLTVEGEMTETVTLENAATAISAPAPGTVVEGLGVANEEGVVVATDAATGPIKRKGPPPRKKKRGPGRGKKKLAFTEGEGVSASLEALADLENGQRRANANGEDQHQGEGEDGDGQNEGDDDDDDGEDDEGDEDEDEDGREEGEIPDSPKAQQQDESGPNVSITERAQTQDFAAEAQHEIRDLGLTDEQALSVPQSIVEPDSTANNTDAVGDSVAASDVADQDILPSATSPKPTIIMTDELLHVEESKPEASPPEMISTTGLGDDQAMGEAEANQMEPTLPTSEAEKDNNTVEPIAETNEPVADGPVNEAVIPENEGQSTHEEPDT